ncbi:amidohydrolase family-domain-containing protein [Xylariales sp. AK1849]|nr:amidohydrolase family-domain-containing protein [Xylariales sp. AK1849]
MDWFRFPRFGGESTLWVYTSAAVVGLAGLFKLRQGFVDFLYTETHCYQSVTTQSASAPHVNCFSVTPSGVFSQVFQESPDSSLLKNADPGYVIPGLWDGHGHLLSYGEFLNSVDLFGSESFEDIQTRVRGYLDDYPEAGSKDEWMRGVGWDQMALGRMPTAEDLSGDERLRDLYIMLDRVDVHCIWVSQPILDLLPASIPDVPGGEIVRDPGMGVFCDNAMDLVISLWPKPDSKKKQKFINSAMKKLNEVGLVGMADAGVMPGNLALYRELAGSQDWSLRVYAMIECDERNTFCPNDVEKHVREDGFLSILSVKLFADGALGSWGSALIEPYSDRPDTSGSLLVNASELTYVTTAWAKAGYQVNIHAIGDLANRHAIDAMTAALRLSCPGESLSECQSRKRFRIEHSQIIHPDDQVRMQSIGIIPSIQPTHATSDMAYAEKRLGKERTSKEAYRMHSLLDIHPILGSDFPVEPPDPFQGIYAAVTRKNPHTGRGTDDFPDGWYAEEALTLSQAMRGFTEGPAYGAFLEGKAGVIQEGAFADWVVLDKPLKETDIEGFRSLKVRETWVAGKMVYKRA